MDWKAPGSHTREHIGTTEDQECPNCGSPDLLSDSSIGLVCTSCSTVIDHEFIVNSSEFTKQSDGSSKLNGQIVGQCSEAYSGVNGIYLSNKNSSRLQTIAKNKAYMYELCHAIKLSNETDDIVDASVRMFTILQQRGFLKGRTTKTVAAMCVYTNCRLEKIPRTMTDFVEATRTNLHDLGKVYTQIKNLLRLQVHPMTAQMLIRRFVPDLDFGKKENDVAKTAELISIRLKKDFIQSGRRPEGICGVAIIMAARIHGFSRTVDEVIEVLKISKVTMEKRMEEVDKTAAVMLNPKDFMTLELPDQEKPPVLQVEDRENQKLLQDSGDTPKKKSTGYEDLEKEMELLLEKTKTISDKELNNIVTPSALGQIEDADINFEEELDLEDSEEPANDLALVKVNRDDQVGTIKDDFSDLSDDEEIHNALLTDEQSKVKAALWHSVNKDYLAKQKLKKTASPAKKKRKLISYEPENFETSAESAAHALYHSVKSEKKTGSSKINYETCKELFNVEVPNF